MKGSFSKVAANENNPKWENMIKRENILYGTKDIRSPFEREILIEYYILMHIIG